MLDSPHEFDDVFITFVKHDEGRNHRRVHFNRTVWLLLTGVHLISVTLKIWLVLSVSSVA